MAESMPFHFIN